MKKFLIGLLVLVVVLAAGSYLLPGHFEVSRSIVIAAESSRVESDLADLETWPEWSAWTKEKDPSVSWSFSGEKGQGQVWEWTGEKLGNGKMRLDKVTPGKGITYGISFKDPDMKGDGQISIAPAGEAIEVTWVSRGQLGKNPIFRYMGLFMDGMLGPDLELGLEGLKARAEEPAAAAPAESSEGEAEEG